MAVLTETLALDAETWESIDKQAFEEKVTREEFVQKAIRTYQRKKAWDRIKELGRDLKSAGITEEDIQKALIEVRDESCN